MSTTTHPLPIAAALGRGLRGALQWRLLLLWALATLLCALLGALPAWGWLGSLFEHSVHAPLIARGEAPDLLLEALTRRDSPMSLLGASSMGAGLLMLVLSPLLVGATVSAIRAHARPGFGDLLRGGIGEYGPMLRMLLWSAVPLGIALAVGSGILAANDAAHKQAVVAAELDAGSYAALAVGGVLFVLAHASLEAGRGWLATDGRLRSALKAWWRGVKLLRRRPLAVLGVYLGTTLAGLLLVALLLLLRPHLGHGSVVGLLLGLLLSSTVAAALAWSRISRLFGMAALAEDAHARR